MNKLFAFIVLAFLASCATKEQVNSDNSLGYRGAEKGDVFGYNNPLEALSDLKSKENHTTRTVSGDHGEWQIINNEVNHTIWSFTPEEHPAHPSVIRRTVYEKNGGVYIRTEVRCGSSKNICDMLVQDFLKLDDKIRNTISAQ